MSLSLVAQTTTPAAPTSSFYEPELNSVLLEAAVDPANLKTPASPSVQQLVGLLATGAVQLRSRVDHYDPIARAFRTTLYLTAPAAPMPLPEANLPAATDATMISQSLLRVDSVYHVPGSPAAIGLVGRFTAFLGGALSVVPGTPFLFSFAYPADAISAAGDQAAAFAESSFLIPGTLNLYSSTAAGTIIVTPAPVTNQVAAPPSSSATHKRTN